MARLKTHAEFVQEVLEVNQNVAILSTYIRSVEKVQCKCLIDGHIWWVRPDSLLRGSQCPKCSGHFVSHEDFILRMRSINPNILIIGQYEKSWVKVKCKCIIDGHIWGSTPDNLSQGYGCPICAGNQRKTHEEFIKDVSVIQPNIMVLGKYVNLDSKIKCMCRIDGHIWYPIPYCLLKNVGCPVCNESKGEKKIRNFLDDAGIPYIHQKTFDNLIGVGGGLLSYDFHIPNYNLLIEFQGEQHEKQLKHIPKHKFQKQVKHDFLKREFAANNNVKLLEIWYWDFDNIEKILHNELQSNIKEVY